LASPVPSGYAAAAVKALLFQAANSFARTRRRIAERLRDAASRRFAAAGSCAIGGRRSDRLQRPEALSSRGDFALA